MTLGSLGWPTKTLPDANVGWPGNPWTLREGSLSNSRLSRLLHAAIRTSDSLQHNLSIHLPQLYHGHASPTPIYHLRSLKFVYPLNFSFLPSH